tara:strand:- start:4583 stop:4786 length:204 start_codon:yes stop_codon:yes gene_type:complete
MNKHKYSNTDRMLRNIEATLRDGEIRAMFKGMGMVSDFSYDSKIDIIAIHYNISNESVRKALHNDKS